MTPNLIKGLIVINNPSKVKALHKLLADITRRSKTKSPQKLMQRLASITQRPTNYKYKVDYNKRIINRKSIENMGNVEGSVYLTYLDRVVSKHNQYFTSELQYDSYHVFVGKTFRTLGIDDVHNATLVQLMLSLEATL